MMIGENDVTISSRIRLARNLVGYPFPHKLEEDKSLEILQRVKNSVSGILSFDKKFTYVEMGQLDPINKQALVERHLISPELFYSNRPSALVLSEDEKVGIMVNEEDHLRIQCIFPGLDLQNAMNLALRVEAEIEKDLGFSFNQRWGYLTSCPTNVGTGLRASVMLHLPALAISGYINEVLQACVRLGLTARGMFGENSEAIGNMFQISNQKTLGQTEEEIVNSVLNIVSQVIEQEKNVRQEMYSKNAFRFEDKIMRAYGLLKSARIISSDESLRHLSDLRVGVDMGIIEGVTKDVINNLLILMQPASLQKKICRPLDAQERDVERARVIREILCVY